MCISEYKNDLEDKLQTHNKINGAIRRHFGKQMNKETKLRIHSEAWVLKKREEQRLEAAQMKFFEKFTWNNKTRQRKTINVLGKKWEHRT